MPQHNGVSKRRNWILFDMVRSMMDFSSLLISFWGYVLESTCYVLNRVPNKSIKKISYKIWMGHKSGLYHLRVLGVSDLYQTFENRQRARSDKYIFIRYLKKTIGYYFYLVDKQKVFVSLRAVFLKKKFLRKELMPLRLNLRKFNRQNWYNLVHLQNWIWWCQTENLL